MTTLASSGSQHHVLGARVLAQSLREADADADVVVLVGEEQVSQGTLSTLRGDGLEVRVVPLSPSRAERGGKGMGLELRSRLELWSMVEYERVVFLDPLTMVTSNPDSLFACEGFCAVAPEEIGEQFSLSVMVLEPDMRTHQRLWAEAQEAEAAVHQGMGAFSWGLPEETALLRSFLPRSSDCGTFEELADADGPAVLPGHHPFVLLNAAHMATCGEGSFPSPPGTCHRLPLTYGASSDLYREGLRGWDEPRIVRFTMEEQPWDSLSFLRKPLFWRWNSLRARLGNAYSGFGLPFLLTALPLLVLACAFVQLAAAVSRKDRPCVSMSRLHRSLSEESVREVLLPWKRRERLDSDSCPSLPTLTICGAAAGGRALPRKSHFRPGWGASASGLCGAAAPRSWDWLWSGVTSPRGWGAYVSGAVAASFSKVWFSAGLAVSQTVVRPDWHPGFSIVVYNAWLACFLVAGLCAVDFAYFTAVTRMRRLLRDAAVLGGISMALWAQGGGSLAMAGIAGMALLHAAQSPRSARLSRPGHLVCIAAACLVAAVATMSLERQRHYCMVLIAQAIFTSGVYAAAVAGGQLLRDGRKLRRLFARSPGPICCGDTVARWGHRLMVLLVLGLAAAPGMHRLLASYGRGPVAPLEVQVHSKQCFRGPQGFLSMGSHLSPTCGKDEMFRPVVSRSAQNRNQFVVCLQASNGKFMSPLRGKLLDTCCAESQFVFHQARSETDGAGKQSAYCMLNPSLGLFMSAKPKPQSLCRKGEQWQVETM